MAASYTDNPSNIADILQFVITDKNDCIREILLAERRFFYDTCAFRKHANLAHPEYIFEFIRKKNGIVVLTRTIIMELASASKCLNTEYIDYFEKMHRSGLKILVMYEEDMFDVLSCYSTSNAQINKYLDVAVRVVKSPTGTISQVYKTNTQLREDIMAGNNTDSTLFERFFKTVRNEKESGDNLGEEMIAVCIHMLANIRELGDYKYIVMTEDKGAIGLINKTQKNIWVYLTRKVVSAVTTVALSQKIYQEHIISTKEQVEELVSVGVANGVVKMIASEEYDLEAVEKTMSCEEAAAKIVTPHAIHIYY